MKRFYVLLSFLSFTLFLSAQPSGYYNSAEGKTGTALRSALHNIIGNHTHLSYSDLWDAYYDTDAKPNGKVWDMYSDKPGGTPAYQFTFGNDQCGSYSGEGDCYNREHTWALSWSNDNGTLKTDLNHVIPTDGYVNNRRSNYPFGEVGSATWTSTNGSKLGSCKVSGYNDVVFEPIDEYKGDIARILFYVSTRYYTEDSGWDNSGMTNKAEIKSWAMTMLLRWHEEDPVSQKEIDRNNEVYGIQHNRNPFIDNPDFAEMIWDPTWSVEEQDVIAMVNVWPNPVTTTLNIKGVDIERINVYNTLGQMVMTYSVNCGAEEAVKLEAGEWERGMYLIQVTTVNGTQICKTFIKM